MLRRALVTLTCLSLFGVGTAVAETHPLDVVIPSETSEGDALAEQFPVAINGQPVEVRAWSGPEWLARFDAATEDGVTAIAAIESPMGAAGVELDDMTMATAVVIYRSGTVACWSSAALATNSRTAAA